MQSDYVATVEENGVKQDYPGSITMKGELFLLTMSGHHVAFDGKTMYTYSEETDELTLTEPQEEELTETNPLLYAKAVAEVCAITEETSKDGTQTIVTLTPHDQTQGVNRFVLKIRNADLMPLEVEVKESLQRTILKFTNPAYISTPVTFTIEPDETTFVNDLRL